MKPNRLRPVIAAATAAALGLFTGAHLMTHIPTGIVGMTGRTGSTGCVCHYYEASPDSVVRAWFTGPDSVRAGTVATYTLSVSRRQSVAAGFNAAALFGRMLVADSVHTQLLPAGDDTLELTHTWPRSASGRDTIAWLFRYRAPLRPGTHDTLYAVGNSVNGDTISNEQDKWAFARNFPVRIIPATSVEEQGLAGRFSLDQNYPNPFNPATIIRFTLQDADRVRLAVYDLTGREAAVLVDGRLDPGEHNARFDATGLAGGVYLYRLQAGGNTLVRKMVLLR
jgi:hypothetical protein